MKFNLKSFPEYDPHTMTHLQYWEKVQAWVIGCKEELRQTLELTEKKWHPRSPRFKGMREECIHRMKEILGDEP